MGVLVGMAGPLFSWCEALPCVEAAGHWLVGLRNDKAGCGTPASPRASAGSLVGGAGSWGL